MIRRVRQAAGVTAVLLAGALIQGQFGASAAAPMDQLRIERPSQTTNWSAVDAATMAKQEGVSVDEMARRLDLQRLVDELPYANLDPGYVEVRTSLKTPFTVDYYSTQGETPAVSVAFSKVGVSSYVRIHLVPYSNDELKAALIDVKADPAMAGAELEILADKGQIAARFPTDQFSAVPSFKRPDGAIPVVATLSDEVFKPTTGGGDQWGGCTTGFVVERTSDQNKMITTAGHCNNLGPYMGIAMTGYVKSTTASFDVRMDDAVNFTWGARFNDGAGGNRTVNGVRSRTALNLGDPVCKNGAATGQTCGYVSSKSICPTYITSCSATFIAEGNGYNQSAQGDSGGPVFYGNTAIGLVSGEGGSGNLDMAFMSVSYIPNFGFQVAIS